MLDITINKTVGILQVLTDKLSGINDKAKENALLTSEYEDLNNKIDILSAMFNSNNSSSESDLVALGILPKPISEFTNDDIGMEISIPYNDESGIISNPILFEVVGVNHHKDVNDDSKPTITLMTKDAIRYAAFDAIEPNNPDSNRANSGNNRWSVSNIRQWLNSDGAANEWFTPQHEYDEAPTADNVDKKAGVYSDNPGFLAGFSPDVLQHFTNIVNITVVPKIDGDGSDTTVDKVFLASYTEMGFGNLIGIAEGTHLSIKYSDNDLRIKRLNGSTCYYWLRSPKIGYYSYECSSYIVNSVTPNGSAYSRSSAKKCSEGLAPLIVLH